VITAVPTTTQTNFSIPSAETLQTTPFTTGLTESKANAFINFGSGPYANDSLITNGNAQPWYDSSQITHIFGGQPTAAQRTDFAKAVVQDVQQAFQLSGVPVTLTSDPNVPAAHMLSLVSNTNAKLDKTAIGMTEVGGSGFSFIDNIAPSAMSLKQLEWITAHNISHELMLAFGVTESYDTSGNYIDARNANMSMMVSPDSTFSPAAAQALLTKDFDSNVDTNMQGAQLIDPQPVPEPATLAFWTLTTAALTITRRNRSRRMKTA